MDEISPGDLIDTLIAAIALRTGCALTTSGRDFTRNGNLGPLGVV